MCIREKPEQRGRGPGLWPVWMVDEAETSLGHRFHERTSVQSREVHHRENESRNGAHAQIGPALADHAEAYRTDYNSVRPHEAIAFNRPHDVHTGAADPAVLNFDHA